MAQRSRNQVPAPASAVRALNDALAALDEQVNAVLAHLDARMTVLEHALSSVISDIYVDDEPADNVSGHDSETRDAERERQSDVRVDPDNPANEVDLIGDPNDEPSDEELEWWSRQEAARLRAEAEADFDPRGEA